MNYLRSLSSFLLLTSLLLSCGGNQRVTKSNLAYIYFDDPTIIHPQYKVFHKNEDESTIYVKVNSEEILYSRNNPEKEFLSRMILQVNIFNSQNDKKALVSDTVFLFDKSGPSKSKFLMGSLDIDLPSGSEYVAEFTFDDMYRMQFVQDVLYIDKVNESSSENYLIKDEKGNVQFKNAFESGQTIHIETSRIGVKSLKMRKFTTISKLPPPPFVDQEGSLPEFKEEESRDISVSKGKFEVTLDSRGIYFLDDGFTTGDGLSLLVFDKYFPYVKSVEGMISPLRYITTKGEYKTITDSENKKKDIDEFWYRIAGNAERAGEIIDRFYTRVEVANQYFTSYLEGWRSDRGLIYIIYGPPSNVTKTIDRENWIYNEKNNLMSVEFTFYKVNNQFSDNDYYLGRAGGYKSSWYRAIDAWRQGRIY